VPELPDITVYVEALHSRVVGRLLRRVVVRSPFLVRTVDPPIEVCEGRRVVGVTRLGKRVVFELEGALFIVVHLMIAGRFRWQEGGRAGAGRIELAVMEFARGIDVGAEPGGVLTITEAGTKKRASMHIVAGREGLGEHHRGGVEPFECTGGQFAAALRRENRTIKRALTDPRIVSGIGNAYGDEILFAARLSPLKLTGSLSPEEVGRLFEAMRRVLAEWTGKLRGEFGMTGGAAGRFPGPGQITAFRKGFAVHGRFGQPCPDCGTPVQRIVYAENETNYCPRCQTAGRVLADRSLSRLLRDDWPRTVDELD
jgi:formamidopyrimidine-DNA glycosylase